MKGLLTKDFLTVKKKYGIARLIMDLAIIAALMIILVRIAKTISVFDQMNLSSSIKNPNYFL